LKPVRDSGVAGFVAIFVLAFIWPYTEEILEAIDDFRDDSTDLDAVCRLPAFDDLAQVPVECALPVVDGVLTILIILFAVLGGAKVRWAVAVPALVLTVACGVLVAVTRQAPVVPYNLLLVVGYTVAFFGIIWAVLGVRSAPGRRRQATMEPGAVVKAVAAAKASQERFRVALPLLIGTFVAFLASFIWGQAFDARKCVEDCWGQSPVYARVGVHQEYFAQLSQIIPLLLIAVGVEARFFDQLRRGAIERSLILVVMITLCLGEVVTISAITAEQLHPWHEYMAFIVTAQACSIALVTLLWALAVSSVSARGS
jgi:hypothetical protein